MTSVRARGGCCLHPHSVQLNVTLLLTVAVHNPNPASFVYMSGHTDLTYRGAKVGEAEIDPGRIPARATARC
ncbi:hypothetical protein ACP70R_021835 [Stipagrostis hirtigluma subsp. patula]